MYREKLYTGSSLKTGVAHHAGPHKEAAEWVKRQKKQEKMWIRAHI